MQLITHHGHRVDRQAELDNLIRRLRYQRFSHIDLEDRQRLKTLLSLQHQEHERLRFAPIN